jgi:predicted nucleic-acid-binding protein
MIGLDTNVLARWVLRDDEAQFLIAERRLSQPFWLSWSVVLELGWLLSSYARLDRNQLSDVIETILALPGVSLDRPDNLRWALRRFRKGGDFADLIHIASTGSVKGFASFEKSLARKAGSESLVPVLLAGDL